MKPVVGTAFARAGLLGNPSDGYEGQAIACALRDFHADVTLEPGERLEIVPGDADRHGYTDLRELAEELGALGSYGGVRLLRAAIGRFVSHWAGFRALPADDPRLRFRMHYRTTIPRQVGLSGSSAIVIAALRALARWFDVELAPAVLAELALDAERVDLGIPAGPMDRVIQAHEGLMKMDFAPPVDEASYVRLDPDTLPPLFLAWDPEPGTVSGVPHGHVRERWLRRDPEVLRAVETLRALVDRGAACLEARDHDGFRKLVDENFDTRAAIFPMRARDVEMVRIGRAAGAAAKFAGSGGAVVGVLPEPDAFDAARAAYERAGYPCIRPEIARP